MPQDFALTQANYAIQINKPFWVKLTDGPDANGFYAWIEQQPSTFGFSGWIDLEGGRTGELDTSPAYEGNDVTVPVGAVVQLRRSFFDETLDWVYVFDAPALAGSIPALTWSGAKRNNSSDQTCPAASTTTLSWDTQLWDSDGYFTDDSTITIPETGLYHVSLNAVGPSENTTATMIILSYILLNGVDIIAEKPTVFHLSSEFISVDMNCQTDHYFTAGQTIQAVVGATGAGVTVSNSFANAFSISKIASKTLGPASSYELTLLSEVFV